MSQTDLPEADAALDSGSDSKPSTPRPPRERTFADDARDWFAAIRRDGGAVAGVDPATGLVVDSNDPCIFVPLAANKRGVRRVVPLGAQRFASVAGAVAFVDAHKEGLSEALHADIRACTAAQVDAKTLKSQVSLQSKAEKACGDLVSAVMSASGEPLRALLAEGFGAIKPAAAKSPSKKRKREDVAEQLEAVSADILAVADASSPKKAPKKAAAPKKAKSDAKAAVPEAAPVAKRQKAAPKAKKGVLSGQEVSDAVEKQQVSRLMSAYGKKEVRPGEQWAYFLVKFL